MRREREQGGRIRFQTLQHQPNFHWRDSSFIPARLQWIFGFIAQCGEMANLNPCAAEEIGESRSTKSRGLQPQR
jgi:hypothetical protein